MTSTIKRLQKGMPNVSINVYPKEKKKRDIGAGRPFKLDVKDRFLMLFVYCRLYMKTLLHVGAL